MEVQIFLLCLYLFLSIVLMKCFYCDEIDKPPDLQFSINSTCINSTFCIYPIHLVCKNNICVCKDGYYPNYDEDKCMKCPGLLQQCDVCCQKGFVCYDNTCYQELNYIQYTSSVAFGVAIVLGIFALGSVIWKIFISSYRLERHDIGRSSQISTTSTNSIQRLVNERLQDRPPTYSETIREQILNRRGLESVESPPPYTLFCREETNIVPEVFNNSNIEDKENSPVELVTEDTVTHI